jgi:3-methyl-2-oxobutanoate hydroxymethyltransferase
MRLTTSKLHAAAQEGRKLTMVSLYDATSAALADAAGVDMLLVGDSLGMATQGLPSTVGVTLEQMCYHTRAVVRGSQNALVIGDLPFGAYQASPEQAFASAAELMSAGAHMVKLEGGADMAPHVEFLSKRGIPVSGHIGLTPQSVHALGGFKVQGKTEEAATRMVADARALQNAGMALVVIEAVPTSLGQAITQALSVPTIGIGAGPHCSGQILLWYDMLGMTLGRVPKFVKNFLAGQPSAAAALEAFVREVQAGTYPAPEHCY